jgi:hypothetical protein
MHIHSSLKRSSKGTVAGTVASTDFCLTISGIDNKSFLRSIDELQTAIVNASKTNIPLL